MCFRCGAEDHFIENYQKPDNPDKKVHCKTEKPKNHAYRSTKLYKTSEDITYQSNSHKIYTSMAHMNTIQKYLEDILKTSHNHPIRFRPSCDL